MPPSFSLESCCSYKPLHDSQLKKKKITVILLITCTVFQMKWFILLNGIFVQLILSCKQQKKCTHTDKDKLKIAMAIHCSRSQQRPEEPQRWFCVSLGQISQGFVTIFKKTETPHLSLFFLSVTGRVTL